MSDPLPLVCLVTPGHLASAPRVIKEADALVEAGYRVHVVSGRSFPPADAMDAEILRQAGWHGTRVDGAAPGSIVRKLARRLARSLVVRSPFASLSVAARAIHADAGRLASAAARVPADLYVGHCLPGLAAAASAARKRRCPYGFDAEDFHDAETEAALNVPADRVSVALLEGRLLRTCAHLTAASPLIGRQYAKVYQVEPRTVLNVFPRSQAPAAPVDPGPVSESRPARVYWFSQTIGPGRGLEHIVEALGRMRTPVELQLRGYPAAGYPAHLLAQAKNAGLKLPIRFLQPGPSVEMARLAADADLGLSIEDTVPLNRDLCLTNKIFVYLLAGIPQLLSKTAAQTALAPELQEAAFLGDLERPAAIAGLLDDFLGSPVRMASARRRAWELAESRFCWGRVGRRPFSWTPSGGPSRPEHGLRQCRAFPIF